MTTDPVQRLADLLRGLYGNGIRHPAHLYAHAAGQDLIRIIGGHASTASTATEGMERAFYAHAIITAAVDGLDQPDSSALFALLDITPNGTKIVTGQRSLTTRRDNAARALAEATGRNMTGESFLRRHERQLTLTLASELWRRIRHVATDTEPDHDHDPRPRRPPPPPDSYRPQA